MRIPWLQAQLDFPPIASACVEPNGLLCAGGDLSAARLKLAYSKGIFPWFNEGEPILWWSPDPRCVLFPEEFTLSKRDRRTLKNSSWSVRSDHNFAAVLDLCAAPRVNYPGAGTWITDEMRSAYLALHAAGHAHSVEVYEQDALIAGIYGVATGSVFCGESMFGRRSNASKAALTALIIGIERMGFALLDAQICSAHLSSRGAREVSRAQFESLLSSNRQARSWCSGLWNHPWTGQS